MKSIYVICVLVAGLVGPAAPGRAQFLKNLVNNVKQDMTNKAAGNAGNNSIGNKQDSTARAAKDSAMLVGIMTKAAKPKPMTAEDSAAVQHFMTATGGSGMQYQYLMRYDFKTKTKDSTFVDTMSTAISDSRNTRAEIDMLGMKMTVLGRSGLPGYSVVLHPESKSYQLNIIDTAKLNSPQGQNYQITRIGTETVGGYSCVHSRLTILGQDKKTIVNEDIWTSAAVPGYAQLKKDLTNQHVTVKMMQELEKAGCDGFIVKVTAQPTTAQSTQISMVMTLITAARRNFPASMFEIPPGYTVMNR
jgi:hypothetical protein